MAVSYKPRVVIPKSVSRWGITLGGFLLVVLVCCFSGKGKVAYSLKALAFLGGIGLSAKGLMEADQWTKEEEFQLVSWGATLETIANPQQAKVVDAQVLESTATHALPPAADMPVWGQSLLSCLQGLGVDCQWGGYIEAPSFYRIKLIPSRGVKFSAFKNLASDLKIGMGYPVEPLVSPEAGFVAIDVPREDRQFCLLESYPANASKPTIPIGVDINNKLIEADLSDPNQPHFLVGGATGGGKSEWLVSVICSLILRFSPDKLQIELHDPKQVSFPFFEGLPWIRGLYTTAKESIDSLKNLVVEMEDRYTEFARVGVRDLAEYESCGYSFPRIFAVFDELADLVADKPDKIAFEEQTKRLAAKARAAGIHLIVCTQRPEANVVTPLIRSNLPGRVALKTMTEEDGKIVMGTDCAASQLLGKGDLLYNSSKGLVRLQSLYVKDPKSVVEKAKSKFISNKSTVGSIPSATEPTFGSLVEYEQVILEAIDNLPSPPENPLLSGLDLDNKLLMTRLVFAKKVSPENALLLLFGVNQESANFSQCVGLLKDLIAALVKQGYSKDNNWGF